MTTIHNAPRRDSLKARLMEFFAANPEEMLTRADIRVKFGVHDGAVNVALAELRKEGLITTQLVVIPNPERPRWKTK